MKPDSLILVLAFLTMVRPEATLGITPEQVRMLPPPAKHEVNFTKEIKPILEASCVKCHGRGKAKGGFKIDYRETLLKGGENGPAVVVGKSAESHLIELVSGLDPDAIMPQKGSKLTPQQVGLLRAWIDQGLTWDAGVSFGKPAPVNLLPRHPELPPARKGVEHPVDRLLQPYFAGKRFQPAKPVEDMPYGRRVYLDVIGLLPSPADLEAFLKDRRPDKRERLVKRLLADNQRYAEHWLTFWNDLLRNDYRGTGYIDGGRKQITPWLFSALATNLPYDRFVAQLINPTEASEGFTKGIVWRGVVNASQTPQLQAAQNISQVFMGVNLKCASCHDSFINDWTLADAYGLANVYADEPLEMFQCDKATGHQADTKFIYPELGAIEAALDQPARRQRLAEIITGQKNARLTRTIVNRLWARFMGRGLVEPLDDMEQAAWLPDLLDWLAADLADHHFDLKRTIEVILTSRAYQLPSVGLDERTAKDFVFRGPAVRRMSAEQYLDALAALTGVWRTLPANLDIDFSAAHSSLGRPDLGAGLWPAAPKWIWNDPNASTATAPQTIYFRKTFHLPAAPKEAAIVASCDNSFTLFINGKEVTSSKDLKKPKLADIRPHLVVGANVIAVAAVNDAASEKAKDQAAVNQDNPAGFLLYARVRQPSAAKSQPGEQVWDFVSDQSWQCTNVKSEGWEKPDFAPAGWRDAAELGGVDTEPWKLGQRFLSALSLAAQYDQVRVSLAPSDPLMTALGRPNREQVMTQRATAATTLQALELTNGSTLAELLRRGAEKLLAAPASSAQDLVPRLYLQALGRKPTSKEFALAATLVGQPVKKEGVEDLLWAMTLLPEFQLIY